jgi:hypothetical protein
MLLMHLLVAILAGPSLAAELSADGGGDVKTFFFATFPNDSPFLPEDPSAQGIFDLRLKGSLQLGQAWQLTAHGVSTSLSGSPATTGGFVQAGFGIPEAVDLSWEAVDGAGMTSRMRMDRLMLQWHGSGIDLTVGRQPITFGKSFLFTPMDLVNPFLPTVIDQEYKPGIDALRLDLYAGMSTQITLVSAYAGDWDLPGTVHALSAQTTVGVWDLIAFGGLVRRDIVGGLGTAGSLGPVGIRAETTLTVPDPDAPAPTLDASRQRMGLVFVAQTDPYVRASVGGDWRPTEKTTLSGELYVQTNGAADPADYLAQSSGPRYARGELWLMGRTYAGLSVAQELWPILNASLFTVTNLEDPSSMLGASLAWSVADNADVAFGTYAGLGEGPRVPDGLSQSAEDEALERYITEGEAAATQYATDWFTVNSVARSEFGLVPVLGFVQMKAYF